MECLSLFRLPHLIRRQTSPCVTIFVNTGPGHPVWSARNIAQYRGHVRACLRLLEQQIPDALAFVRPLLSFIAPNLEGLADLQSLAIYRSRGLTGFVPLNHPIISRHAVGQIFHVRPLLHYLVNSKRYHFVTAYNNTLHLHLGQDNWLEKVASFQFNSESISRISSLLIGETGPLFFAGTENAVTQLRQTVRYSHINHSLNLPFNDEADTPQQALALILPYIERNHLAERNAYLALLDKKHLELSAEQAVHQIVQALRRDDLAALFVTPDSYMPGEIHWETGHVAFYDAHNSQTKEDVIETLVSFALSLGVPVFLLDADQNAGSLPIAGVARTSIHQKHGMLKRSIEGAQAHLSQAHAELSHQPLREGVFENTAI